MFLTRKYPGGKPVVEIAYAGGSVSVVILVRLCGLHPKSRASIYDVFTILSVRIPLDSQHVNIRQRAFACASNVRRCR